MSDMMPAKSSPRWPSDDQLRERDRDRVFTDDGRKLQNTEHVGERTPDTDPAAGGGAHSRGDRRR